MPVRDSSMDAFEVLRERDFEPLQQQVLSVLVEIGPADDQRILEALQQKESQKPRRLRKKWAINTVTGRRNALADKLRFPPFGIIEDLGRYLISGRRLPVHIWRVRGDERQPPWKKYEEPNAEPSAAIETPEMAPPGHLFVMG